MRIRLHVFVLSILMLAAQSLQAQDEQPQEAAAEAAAEQWIALVDVADYAESWQEASPAFQTGISADDWEQAADQVRSQVGELQDRTLMDSQYRTSLPNAPEGEYVILQYQSSFERLPQAMEMVVMTMTENEEWRAAGYQVVPAQQQDPNQPQSPPNQPNPQDQPPQDQPDPPNQPDPQDR